MTNSEGFKAGTGNPGAILADECWDSESQGRPCWSGGEVGGSWGGDRRSSLTSTPGASSVSSRVPEGPLDAPLTLPHLTDKCIKNTNSNTALFEA